MSSPVDLSSVAAFCVFLCVNLLASTYAPIQDCDEVFNYWEPTHYIVHGFGLQTWEYSPEYAIRSWLYALIHAIPSRFAAVFVSKKVFEFYFVRGVLGSICAGCETRLFSTISRTMDPRIAVIFLLAMVSSSGMFHASVAYLPSSFAMYTAMMGAAAFMYVKDGLKTTEGIMWFGVGATVGWPFSAALILPFIPDELTYLKRTADIAGVASRVVGGVLRTLAIVSLQVAVDLLFYGKVVFVPWRIVSYNILSGSSRGPNIFGTEPWHFYIRNLLLNFNAWFLLAMCAGPLLGLQLLFTRLSSTRWTALRSMMISSPFYMWLAIFSAQSHKEERFMYPAYPFLCLNAAIAMHTVLNYLGHLSPKSIIGKVPAKARLALVGAFVLAMAIVGVLRTVGTVSAYSAPLEIYRPLQSPEYVEMQGNVCLGKEWYRFPSSYFLPKNMRLKFVKSAFDGLLPGEFSEAGTVSGIIPTWLMPPGMNDQNIEDPGKHVDVGHCSFMVDSIFSGSDDSMLEPNFIADGKNWEQIQCHKFLDTSQTHPLGRIIWIPDSELIPTKFRRQWGRYCLLGRKSAPD